MTFPTEYSLADWQWELLNHMQKMVDAWVAGDETMKIEIEKMLDSFDYQMLPYAVRNKPFVTSHKLLKYKQNPIFAYLSYKKLIPSCKDSNSAFDVGTAVDRRLTYGDKDYEARFIVKNRPPEHMLEEATKNHQIILSESEGKTVDRCTEEYRSRHFFPERPIKKNVLCVINGLPLKAEMDHYDEKKKMFEDLKTCANITTFNPHFYVLQMVFYYLLLTREANKTMSEEAYETFRRELSGSLCVVDKNNGYSRSHKWIYTNEALQADIPEVMDLLNKWKDSEESGIWPNSLNLTMPDDLKTFWDSDLYPHLSDLRDQMQPTFM